MSHETTVAFEIDSLQQELETLAEGGKWSRLALLLKRRNTLLSNATNIDRAMTVRAAVRSNARLLKLAQVDRQAVAHRLISLRRSRKATGYYEAHHDAGKLPSGA